MKKVFLLCLTLTLSISTLSGCSTNNPVNVDTSNDVNTNSNIQTVAEKLLITNLGLPSNLNLTSEQIAQIDQLKKEANSQIDYTKIEDTVKIITDAFNTSYFDFNTLKTKLNNLNLQNENYYTTEAGFILDSYNLLTEDQKQILDSSGQSIFSNDLLNSLLLLKFGLSETTFNKLVAELDLTIDQQESIKNLMSSSESPELYFQTKQENIKDAKVSINNQLKAGNATVENIAKIIEELSINISSIQNNELKGLIKISNILTVSQRNKFVNNSNFVLGLLGIEL